MCKLRIINVSAKESTDGSENMTINIKIRTNVKTNDNAKIYIY